MQTNALPAYDASDNPTQCCPRFNPDGWDHRNLHFEDKLFVRATTKSENYIPIGMAEVFERTFADIDQAGAYDEKDFIILSRDVSPSQAEHFFAVSKEVPDKDTVHWNGDFLTRVFEGPYEYAPKWEQEIRAELTGRGNEADTVYFFYTTCPKCLEVYGKNYVVVVAALAGEYQGAEAALT